MSISQKFSVCTALIGVFATVVSNPAFAQEASWLAGDHHIHSRFSVRWDREFNPPRPIPGGDAIYPIHLNAQMAKYFGLGWMVSTDHGGPQHSRVNFTFAYLRTA